MDQPPPAAHPSPQLPIPRSVPRPRTYDLWTVVSGLLGAALTGLVLHLMTPPNLRLTSQADPSSLTGRIVWNTPFQIVMITLGFVIGAAFGRRGVGGLAGGILAALALLVITPPNMMLTSRADPYSFTGHIIWNNAFVLGATAVGFVVGLMVAAGVAPSR